MYICQVVKDLEQHQPVMDNSGLEGIAFQDSFIKEI